MSLVKLLVEQEELWERENMKDFSGHEHIDLIVSNLDEGYNVGDIIASIKGNNFGDQNITYRLYYSNAKESGFKTIGYASYFEGSHLSPSEMVTEVISLLNNF